MGRTKATRAEFNAWTNEQKEVFLVDSMEETIAANHASDLSIYQDDEKGIYLQKPDGSKEYVQFYEER